MKRKLIACVLMLTTTLASCSEGPREESQTLYYADQSEQQQLKRALERAGIPFEVRSGAGGREEILYASRLEEKVARVRGELFGVPSAHGQKYFSGS
jgi:hypothetical protein